MTETDLEQAFQRIAERIDTLARLVRHWPLTGGVSAQIGAIELERYRDPGRRLDLVHFGKFSDRFQFYDQTFVDDQVGVEIAHNLPVIAHGNGNLLRYVQARFDEFDA